MLRIPHCLDIRLTDGGVTVSLTPRSRSTAYKHNFSASGTNFFKRLSKPQGLVRTEGLGNFFYSIEPDWFTTLCLLKLVLQN
jgi:hypothetical protein